MPTLVIQKPTSISEMSAASEPSQYDGQRRDRDEQRARERQDDQDRRQPVVHQRDRQEDDGEDREAARERERVRADEPVLARPRARASRGRRPRRRRSSSRRSAAVRRARTGRARAGRSRGTRPGRRARPSRTCARAAAAPSAPRRASPRRSPRRRRCRRGRSATDTDRSPMYSCVFVGSTIGCGDRLEPVETGPERRELDEAGDRRRARPSTPTVQRIESGPSWPWCAWKCSRANAVGSPVKTMKKRRNA